MMVSRSKLRRYPGTKPFTRDQASLFFGRAADIKRLNDLISLESVVVVYGKSGYGKSSLINAGLLPQLEVNSDNICLMPRLNAWKDHESISPLGKTRQSLKGLSKDYSILDKVLDDDDSLWRKLKAFQIANPEKRLHLFFDQFEELFTYPAAHVNEFKLQMAELVRKQVPRRYERALDIKGAVDDEVLTFEEEGLLYKGLNLRIVFIIRSDKMHLLDLFSDHIPKILKNNYEIKALSRSSAASALIEPALLKGADYLTPPFDYDQSAQDKVLDFLEDDNTRLVEAIQLQILATSFEDEVHKNDLKVLTSDNIGDLESIVKNYYNDRLRSLGSYGEIVQASKMIEEGLVDKERHQRLTLHEGQIKSIYDVEEDLLNKLVENHLLRRQPDTRSGYNYELSHDTLIAPVLAARSIREKKEAAEEYARTQHELSKERGRRRKATFIAVIAAIASILAGYYAYTAFKQEKTIEAQRQENHKQLIINQQQDSLNQLQELVNDEMKFSLLKEQDKTDSLLKVAAIAENDAQFALASARIALREAQYAREEAVEANVKFANEVEKGKELEKMISGNDPYSVYFLSEEGDRQLGNNNFQNALTYYAAAKFVLERDKESDTLTYKRLVERIDITSKMSQAENMFKSGDFEEYYNYVFSIEDNIQSELLFPRISGVIINRNNQIGLAEEGFWEAEVNAVKKFGDESDVNHIIIGSEDEPAYFTVLPRIDTAKFNGLEKLTIYTTSSELYLNSMPPLVDSLEIISSNIAAIPSTDYHNNQLSSLRIHDCENLKTIGEEILNYDILEKLVITQCPNIERVTYDIMDLMDIIHLDLADNPNLFFIPYTMSRYPPDLETLKLRNLELGKGKVIMGVANSPEEYWKFESFDFGSIIGVFKTLKTLELDNVFFSDLHRQGFNFSDYPLLSSLRLANLKDCETLPPLITLSNLEKLSIENLPVSSDMMQDIAGLTQLKELVLADLSNLIKWADLSGLKELTHLTLKNIPVASNLDELVASLPKLEYLVLEEVTLGPGINQALNSLKNLKVLKINKSEINDLVIDPLNMGKLEKLELLGNSLLIDKKSWLDSIPLLTNLKKLSITTHYPEFIGRMVSLSELYLEYPKDVFPQIFNSAMKLEKLFIGNSYAKKLPSSIGALKDLKTFFLLGTAVTSLNELTPLDNLEHILLMNNGSLLALPREMNDMKHLKRIIYFNTFTNTSRNRLAELLDDVELVRVNSLKEFQKVTAQYFKAN